MRKVVVLPRVKGNGHGGSFVGRRGNPKLKHVVDGTKSTAPRQEWRAIAEVGLISHKTHALFVLVKTLIQMIGNITRMHFLILQVVVLYT